MNNNLRWLKDCEICNTGLCSQFQEYVEQGMSERAAARQMEKDCGNLWSADKIYGRYRYYAKGHGGGSVGKTHRENSELVRVYMQKFVGILQQKACPDCEKDPMSCEVMLNAWLNPETYKRAIDQGILSGGNNHAG